MDPATAAAAGNSSGDLVMGGGIAISGVIVLKILEFAGQWFMTRNQKAQVGPQPFEVSETEKPRTCKNCIERHQLLDKSRDEEKKDNKDAHENVFLRLSVIEKEQGTTAGKLDMLIEGMKRVETKVDAL
jgi:hypothetical protein